MALVSKQFFILGPSKALMVIFNSISRNPCGVSAANGPLGWFLNKALIGSFMAAGYKADMKKRKNRGRV